MPKTFIAKLREDVGQLLIMGFDGVEVDARLSQFLTDLRPGGVILFSRNVVEAAQAHALLATCQQAVGQLLFRCVDLEGGTVDRLRDVIAPAPPAAAVAATQDPGMFRRHGRILGEEARALGFNVDFAPVLDLGLAASKQVMGTRTASADPLNVVGYAREVLRGLREAGVLGCGKHFPGLGSARADSHLELPVVEKPWPSLWEEDLIPYRYLRRKMRFVMVAHAAFPQVTGDRTPASLSAKWMTGVLRKRIRYAGLIISDDLEMGGVLAAGSVEDVAVASVQAGADMLLVCRQQALVQRAYEAVLRRAERDARFLGQVRKAAQRVRATKSRIRSLRQWAPPPTNKKLEQLRRALEQFAAEVRQEGTIL
ncbi:MAG: beta-N-acetylhexosaminidase [Acidobacteria bacterium]|nr:beta-N-acetylhexosaminidase [Acidobacteriota bacterium]